MKIKNVYDNSNITIYKLCPRTEQIYPRITYLSYILENQMLSFLNR